VTDLHGWITQQVDNAETLADRWHDIECDVHRSHLDAPISSLSDALCRCGGPTAARRRCAADRKILGDHTTFGDDSVHCIGCGIDYESGPLVDNVNDCPTLLALAEGYGLTPEILAGLDRPQAPEPKRRGPTPDTRRVPPALRGPNWKGTTA
jgi:hypothetical protein